MSSKLIFVDPSITVGSSIGVGGMFGTTILGSFIPMILSRANK